MAAAGNARLADPAHGPRIPVLLFGHSVTTLGAMRLLGRRGVPSFVVSPGRTFIARSRWYRVCPNATEEYPTPADLPEFLQDLPLERAVLMACADDWVPAVASLDADLRERFPASVADPATIKTLLDKGLLRRELDRLGLLHPVTVDVATAEDLEALPDELFGHAFLKPRDSLSFTRRFGAKAFRVRDKANALARFAEVDRAGQGVVLQELIPGSATDHYFVEGFVDREGRSCARFARRRLRMWPPDFGASTYAVSVPLESVAAASEAVDRLVAAIPYRGVYSAEFMFDRRDASFRLLEVNVRPYVHIEFTGLCGMNLCEMAYRDALGLPVETVADYEIGRRSLDLDNDLPAAIRLVTRGELGPLSWLRSFLVSDGHVFAWDDPAPGLYRIKNIVRRQLRMKSRG